MRAVCCGRLKWFWQLLFPLLCLKVWFGFEILWKSECIFPLNILSNQCISIFLDISVVCPNAMNNYLWGPNGTIPLHWHIYFIQKISILANLLRNWSSSSSQQIYSTINHNFGNSQLTKLWHDVALQAFDTLSASSLDAVIHDDWLARLLGTMIWHQRIKKIAFNLKFKAHPHVWGPHVPKGCYCFTQMVDEHWTVKMASITSCKNTVMANAKNANSFYLKWKVLHNFLPLYSQMFQSHVEKQ